MSRNRRALLVASLLALGPATAFAQAAPTPPGAPPGPNAPDGNKALAIEWADKAQDRFDAGDYRGALEAIEEAQTHARPPTFAVFQARTQEKLGRLVEAKALFTSVADMTLQPRDPPAWKAAQEDARKDLAALLPRIPQLHVTVTGADAATSQVMLDDAPLDPSRFDAFFPINPGKHTLTAEANGRKVHEDLDVREGTRHYVAITLTAQAPVLTAKQEVVVSVPKEGTTPAGQRSPLATPGVVALGVGGAGLVLGAVTGGLAITGREEARKSCGVEYDAQQRCATAAAGPLHDAQTMARVSTGALVVAGVAAAAGVTLLVLSRKKDPPVGVAVTPGFVVVRGAF